MLVSTHALAEVHEKKEDELTQLDSMAVSLRKVAAVLVLLHGGTYALQLRIGAGALAVVVHVTMARLTPRWAPC